jgi:hypothetical protein
MMKSFETYIWQIRIQHTAYTCVLVAVGVKERALLCCNGIACVCVVVITSNVDWLQQNCWR